MKGGCSVPMRVVFVVLFLLAMVTWLLLRCREACFEVRLRAQGEMRQHAEMAIKAAGGSGALETEAKMLLRDIRVISDWKTPAFVTNNCPAVVKVGSVLRRNGHSVSGWLVGAQENLPAHVVIRFGSHSHYEYVWIFDPADVVSRKIERAEHLGGAVYLSKENR